MRDKYWAKNKYSTVDPADYESARFRTYAGKLIDETEKSAVLELIWESNIQRLGKINILDVATGPGRLAFYMEKIFKNATITALDINRNMLSKAKKSAMEEKSNVRFIQGDIYKMPFPDKRFDILTGLRFSMHLPDTHSWLRELARVVKKNGILIFDILNAGSILKLKTSGRSTKNQNSGWYTVNDMIDFSGQNGLELTGKKGIFLLGETPLRMFPEKLLFILSGFVRPPSLLQNFSSKIVLCFRKI